MLKNIMRNNLSGITLGVCVMLLVAGCSQMIATDAPDLVSSTETAQTTETQGGSPTMNASSSTPGTPGLEGLIEKVKEDLAQRLSISADQINLVEAVEVEWSDSSLDCPQSDMSYLQVITPGYRILLDAGGQAYEYHSNRDAYFVYCENSVPPALPKP